MKSLTRWLGVMATVGLAWLAARAEPAGYAVPRKDLYFPLPAALRRSVVTYPNMTYPLVHRAQNGFILYHEQDGPPTLGFLPFEDRISAVADQYGGLVRARRQVALDAGSIPLAKGKRYEVLHASAAALSVRFTFQSLAFTVLVSRADADLLPVETVQGEQAEQQREEQYRQQGRAITAVLAAARAAATPEAAIALLEAAIRQYPDHPRIAECSVLLEDLQRKKILEDTRRELEKRQQPGTPPAPPPEA